MQTLRLAAVAALSLLSNSIHAGPTDLLNSATDKLKNKGDANCWLCISARNPEEASLREKCVAQLCPTPTVSDEEVTAEARKNSETDPEYKKAEKLVLDTLLGQVRARRHDDQFLLDSLRQNVEFKNPQARAYVRLSRTASPAQYLKTDTFGDFDFEATKKAMLDDHKSPEDADFYVKFYRTMFTMKEDPKAAFSDYDTLKSTLSESDLKKRLLGGLQEMQQTAQQLSRVTGLPREAFYSDSNAKEDRKQIEDGTLSDGRFDDIQLNLISNKIRLQMFARPNEWGKETGEKIALRDILPPKIEDRLKMQIAVADKVLSGDLSKDERPYYQGLDRVYRKCDYALSEGYAMSPSPEQLEKFKSQEVQYRKEFAKNLERFLSAKSAAAISKAAESWKIKMPLQREQFLAAFSERIASGGEGRSFGELAKNSTGKSREFALVELAGNSDLKDDDDYFDSMNLVCTAEVPQAFGDRAQFRKESVAVSPRTVVRPDYAKQILFHEYSHLLSTAIDKNGVISTETKQWYNSLRKCLDEQRGTKKLFTEEDFAQSMAVALAPESTAFLCEKEIPWTKDEMFTLKDSRDKNHSGPIYNLVLGLFARGESFDTCRAAFAEIGEKEIPQNCFEKVQPASTAK